MIKRQDPEFFSQGYEFNGLLYLPKPVKINGKFILEYYSSLEGNRISVEENMRNKMKGILLNTKAYCFPGAENNPRNILAFALFSSSLTNQFFYLACPGSKSNYSGIYSGTADLGEHSSKGIEPTRFMSGLCYIDYYLQNEKFNKVELQVSLINEK
jgi:hypothetical protein